MRADTRFQRRENGTTYGLAPTAYGCPANRRADDAGPWCRRGVWVSVEGNGAYADGMNMLSTATTG